MNIHKIFNFYQFNNTTQNVLALTAGTTLSQLILVATAPILTRLYTPRDFGLFALYISLSSIIAVLSTGCYEFAIMLPKKDSDAIIISILCLSLICSFCPIFFFAIFILNTTIANILKSPELKYWLFFLPISVLLTGIYSTLYNWSNRKQEYHRISVSRVFGSVVNSFISLLFGFWKLDIGGLILGNIIGQGISIGLLCLQFYKDFRLKTPLFIPSKIELYQQAKKYINFPRYSLPTNILNAITQQLPIILLNNFFGATIVGFYSLTQKVIGIPLSILSGSITDIFRQRSNEEFQRQGNCHTLFRTTFKRLVLISLIPFLCLFIFAPSLFSIIFNKEWHPAGEYARILSILFFFSFTASPLSYILYVTENQRIDLICHIILIIAIISSIMIGVYYQNPVASIRYYTLSYSLIYINYLVLSYNFSKGNINIK